jgi:hypothetical protein
LRYFGRAIAHTGTSGHWNSTLVYDSQGRLRILDAWGYPVWNMCADGFARG